MEPLAKLYRLCVDLPNNELNCSEERVDFRELFIILAETPDYESSRGGTIFTDQL
jgi:hypothetical protein